MNHESLTCLYGEYPILIKRSIRKGWKHFEYAGAIHFGKSGHASLYITPGVGESPRGWYAVAFISADFDHSVMMEIKQRDGHNHVLMTIWKHTKPDEPVHWSFAPGITTTGLDPCEMIMYPELEQLLNYLIETQ